MNTGLAETTDETVAILLEEVARLESEVRSLEETARHHIPAEQPLEHPQVAPDADLLHQIESLVADLAARDETINLLLKETELFEQAATAQRAEWEQLHQWIEQVEKRVDENGGRGAEFEEELEAERHRFEGLRQSGEIERRAAESRQKLLQREIDELQSRLARTPIGHDSESLIEDLQSENRRLRTACIDLQHSAESAAAVGPLLQELEAARGEIGEVKRKLIQMTDELQRERNEHEVELSKLRRQNAVESLHAKESEAETDPLAEHAGAAIEADERIRAFREHLRELHKNETEQHAGRSLSARLSRLWRSTGPG